MITGYMVGNTVGILGNEVDMVAKMEVQMTTC